MALEVYRPGQGNYARIGTGVALVILGVFSAVRFYQLLPAGSSVSVIGLRVPLTALWAALLFIGEALIACYFLVGPDVGGPFLRKQARKFIDLLIDTQTELQKVVWPTRDDLVSSTVVVIATLVLLGVFIFCVDVLVSRLMVTFGILPRTTGS